MECQKSRQLSLWCQLLTCFEGKIKKCLRKSSHFYHQEAAKFTGLAVISIFYLLFFSFTDADAELALCGQCGDPSAETIFVRISKTTMGTILHFIYETVQILDSAADQDWMQVLMLCMRLSHPENSESYSCLIRVLIATGPAINVSR